MCLILLSYEQHPRYPLIVAANRDEYYERPTAPAAFWTDAPHVLAGRDRVAGGTWMGVTREARWAALTNYRDPDTRTHDAPSRGALVANYLRATPPPAAYMQRVAAKADQYNGFNLFVGRPGALMYYSNRNGTIRSLSAGVYGLSNHLLDTGWPKVERGRKKLRQQLAADTIEPDALLDLLHDTTRPADERLPETGIGLAGERLLSPMFIEGDHYGTRSSTVLIVHRSGRVTFVERTFEEGEPAMTQRYDFDSTAAPDPTDA